MVGDSNVSTRPLLSTFLSCFFYFHGSACVSLFLFFSPCSLSNLNYDTFHSYPFGTQWPFDCFPRVTRNDLFYRIVELSLLSALCAYSAKHGCRSSVTRSGLLRSPPADAALTVQRDKVYRVVEAVWVGFMSSLKYSRLRVIIIH